MHKDAQIAYLLREGFADFAISGDSDLIAYGCDQVLAKLGLNGEGDLFSFPEILKGLNMAKDQFLNGCIAAGCDYLKNVRGVRIHKAFTFAKKLNMFVDLRGKGSSDDYECEFAKAKAVFLHQTIIDLVEEKTKPLCAWDIPPSKEIQHYCGDLLPGNEAKESASGNIDLSSGIKLNSFPHFKKRIRTSELPCPQEPTNQCHCHDNDIQTDDLDVEIENIDSESDIEWKIPCFPVLKLKFNPAKVKITTRIEDSALIPNDQLLLNGHAVCTSYCSINLSGKKCLVLWKVINTSKQLQHVDHISGSEYTSSVSPSDEEQHAQPNEDDKTHTLPFKVLGSCYSTDRQNALKNASECLYEHNRHVMAKLVVEPGNVHDSNAVAVTLCPIPNLMKKLATFPEN